MKALLASILLFTSAATMAAATQCAANEEVLFSCQTGKKVASVCTKGGKVQYRFGPMGAPEAVYPANGDQRAFVYEHKRHSALGVDMTWLTVKNGAYAYQVSSGTVEGGENYGAVDVYKNNKNVATLKCKLGSINYLDFNSLDALNIREE